MWLYAWRVRNGETQMTTKRNRTKNSEATRDAISHVREIANAQRRIAEILSDAARRVRNLEEMVSKHGEDIETAVTRQGADAGAIAKAMAEYRVRTGDLSSRLVSAIERRGHQIFPTQYTPIESPWALVENLH
jgi:hypothetical protein